MTVKSSTWSLKLSDLSFNDFGNYSCQASNILGTARGYSGVTGTLLSLKFEEELLKIEFSLLNYWPNQLEFCNKLNFQENRLDLSLQVQVSITT